MNVFGSVGPHQQKALFISAFHICQEIIHMSIFSDLGKVWLSLGLRSYLIRVRVKKGMWFGLKNNLDMVIE